MTVNNQLIRCIVVDDDFPAIRLLAGYVKNTPGLELVLKTTEALEALEVIKKGLADLVFLDIQMPKITGLEFMECIQHTQTKVILTTAYSKYAIDGYEHDVVDYLLKPITYERYLTAIQKVKDRLLHLPSHSGTCTGQIFLKTEYRLQKTEFSDIMYIEGLGDYLLFYTIQGKIVTLERMKNMEKTLPAECFMRIHKSYLVNIRHIRYLEKGKIVVGEKHLPVGGTYREVVKARLGWK